MAVLNTFIKQPAESLDYDIDYSDWLDSGDSLLSATAVSDVAGLTLAVPLVVGKRVKLWVSGGTNGAAYKVTITTRTALNRIKQDEIRFRIKDY